MVGVVIIPGVQFRVIIDIQNSVFMRLLLYLRIIIILIILHDVMLLLWIGSIRIHRYLIFRVSRVS